jgi:hypothetical protein
MISRGIVWLARALAQPRPLEEDEKDQERKSTTDGILSQKIEKRIFLRKSGIKLFF